MATTADDWIDVLHALLEGDRVALVKVSSVVTGYLARYRAYEIRDSWDDLVQDVLVALIASGREGRIRDARAFVSYVGHDHAFVLSATARLRAVLAAPPGSASCSPSGPSSRPRCGR